MNDTAIIQKSIARVISPAGNTVGTAFLVSSSGYLLTCWHVIADMQPVQVLIEGESTPLVAEVIRDLSNSQEDVAVLKISRPCSHLSPLGIDWSIGTPVWSYGYQYQKIVSSGYPVSGVISGETKITNEHQLIVVSGTDFQKGLSGAPLVNRQNGLVVGIVNALFEKKGWFCNTNFNSVETLA